jgi:hypothetical protein
LIVIPHVFGRSGAALGPLLLAGRDSGVDDLALSRLRAVTQAERPAIQRAAALLPDGEYTAQLAAGRSQTIDDALTAALPILQDRQPAATR